MHARLSPLSNPPSVRGSSIPPTGEIRVKGISIRSYLTVLEAEHGVRVLQHVLQVVDTELARAVRHGTIAPGRWYSIAWYRALHKAAQNVLGLDPSFSRRMGYLATKAELGGIYKVFARLLSPEMTLRLGAKLFRTYYDRGYFKVLEWGSGHARGRWEACTGFDESIWEDVVGGIMAFLETAGARQVRPRVLAGGRDGDASMELEADWK